MKASEIKTYVKGLYPKRKPTLFIEGSPGIGKTSVIYQVGDELTKELGRPVPVAVFQALLYDPVELKGLPVYQDGVAKWVKFTDFPSGDDGIFFVDDLPNAEQMVQAGFYRILLERWNIDGYFPIGAGNRVSDKSGVNRMPTALANRMIKVEMDVDYGEWRGWAIEHGVAGEVIACLGWRKTLLNQFDPTKDANATPRSWEFVSDVIKAFGINHPLVRSGQGLNGAVGAGAASEFLGYLKVYKDLPNLDKIVKGENIYPDANDIMFAVVSELVKIAQEAKNKKPIFGRLLDYATAMPEKKVEFGFLIGADLSKLDRSAIESVHKNYLAWAERYGDYIL